MATGAAAATSVGGNLVLVPRFGAIGAAWTNAAAYAVLASIAFVLSQRVYPMPLEWGRLARLGVAGTVAYRRRGCCRRWPPSPGRWSADRSCAASFPAAAALGFYDARELRTLGRMLQRVRRRPAPTAGEPAADRVPIVRTTCGPTEQQDVHDAAAHGRRARSSRLARRDPRARRLAARDGLAFGLPAVYNPDEIAIMSRALAFAKGDLNPHNFLYPTFYFYVLFAWVGASFVVTWLLGMVPSLAAFQAQFFTDPTDIYLAGRLLGVTCGVATVLLTYALGARLAGAGAGRAPVSPPRSSSRCRRPHVRDSHYVKHDVPVTLDGASSRSWRSCAS